MQKSEAVLLSLFFVLLIPAPASGEPETLIGGEVEHGFFVGPAVRFSETLDEFSVFPGIRGGWIIDHALSVGLAGYGLANEIRIEGMHGPDGRDLEFGYGGLEIEYILAPDELVHLTISALVGAGGVTLPHLEPDHGEAVFVLEPVAGLALNLASFARIHAGAGFRWVSGSDSQVYDNDDLSAFSGGISLLFGRF